MAQYGLETETTTHLKGMGFDSTPSEIEGMYRWVDMSYPKERYRLVSSGYYLCICPSIPEDFPYPVMKFGVPNDQSNATSSLWRNFSVLDYMAIIRPTFGFEKNKIIIARSLEDFESSQYAVGDTLSSETYSPVSYAMVGIPLEK